MATKFLFFSGKGGVGKTSMACTTAVHLAETGQRTLIVTTDPASNLADVFEQPIGHKVTSIEAVPGLWAMEIDPDRATFEYKERALAPLRTLFPAEIVKVMEEQMAGPCTAEVAAFDRFTDFIDAPSAGGEPFDTVIFDTAPTGHTLRLLELPAEWSHSIEQAALSGGQTCIGPAAAIQEQKAKYDRAIRAMVDPQNTTFTFVLHPEASAIRETERSISELRKLGIDGFRLIVNGVIPQEEAANPFFAQRRKMQQAHMAEIGRRLPYPSRTMYLFDGEIKGASRLRAVARMLFGSQTDYRLGDRQETVNGAAAADRAGDLAGGCAASSAVIAEITPQSGRRTIFFAGKGGVGKTVLSCVTAAWLGGQGYKTLLLTTDPAEHISDVLEAPVGDVPARYQGIPNLWVTKIDAKAAAEAYRARILEDARQKGRSPEAIASMAEELDSPCTEEMAAFDRFIDYASQDEWDVIVFDTAPTGHTLRLLELPVDWSQQLDVKIFASVDTAAADDVAKKRFGKVIDMMKDPDKCTFAFVMYPESTPIVESQRAMDELRTVGIEPGLVVANQVLPDEVASTAYGRSRQQMQRRYMADMRKRFQVPILEVPLMPKEIAGIDMLVDLGSRLFGDRQTMNHTVVVRIFGVPMACSKGVVDAWRNVANQARGQLAMRFGDRVTVEYYDLLSPEMERFPHVLAKVSEGAQVPLVFVNGELLSSGGKVSVPAIAKHIKDVIPPTGVQV